MKRFVVWFLLAVLVIAALALGKMFPDANSTPVDVDLLWFRVPNIQVWLLLTTSMILGAVLATLVVGFAWVKGRVLNRRYRKIIKRLESELHQLRSLPLASDEPRIPERSAKKSATAVVRGQG